MNDPYRIPAGPELDALMDGWLTGQVSSDCPAYSTDDTQARRVLEKLETLLKTVVIIGRTSSRNRNWFARYQTNPSDGVEVWAETRALAICRLVLLYTQKRVDESSGI